MSYRTISLLYQPCGPLNRSDLVRRRAYMVYYILFGKDPDHVQHLAEVLADVNHSSASEVVTSALMLASKVSRSFWVHTFLIGSLASV